MSMPKFGRSDLIALLMFSLAFVALSFLADPEHFGAGAWAVATEPIWWLLFCVLWAVRLKVGYWGNKDKSWFSGWIWF